MWEDPLLESFITNSRGVKGESYCEHREQLIIKGIDTIFSPLQHNAFIHHISPTLEKDFHPFMSTSVREF